MKNKLKEVVWFWSLWEEHKEKNNGKISDLTKVFKKHKSFNGALEEIEGIVFDHSVDIFHGYDENVSLELKKKSNKLFQILTTFDYFVVTYDQYPQIPLLKNIEKSPFFFIKGNLELLKEEETISIVGSRKTPSSLQKWIENNLPKKPIVSGMAFGADLMGHNWAIENNLPIIVFPGIDIHKPPTHPVKKKVYEYALQHGLLISSIFPGSKTFDKSIFLQRNKWMAQITSSTYVVYFEGISGTLGHMLEMAKTNKQIFMSEEVFAKNKEFLQNNKTFSIICNSTKVVG